MSNEDNNLRRFENYELDLEKKILWFENAPVELPVKAVELLCVLIEGGGKVVAKDELLDKIWNDSFVEEGVLPQNVYLLRKFFKEHGIEENLIQTIPRRGYRFTGEVAETFEEEIVIERETFERKLIAETELSDQELERTFANLGSSQTARLTDVYERKATKPRNIFERKFSIATFAAVLLFSFAAVSFLLWFWIYPNFAQRNSAGALPENFNRNIKYERLSESGRVVAVGLSNDNIHAAYVIDLPENKFQMVLQHLPTGSETVVIPPQNKHLFSIRFSPDDNYIYYGASEEEKPINVMRMPIYGGVSETVLQDFTNYFTLSPDGEWLAFFRRVPEENAHYLEIARSRDGSGRRTVVIRKNKEIFSIWGTAPAWSPDGKKLLAAAFVKNDDPAKPMKSVLVEINVADGKQTNIETPANLRSFHEPYYSADGKSIFVKVRENNGEPVQIWQLDLPTGKARNITNDTNDYREFRAASDASFLITAVWSKSENLFLIPVENPKNLQQLTFDSIGQNGTNGLNWTIDGKNLIYTKTKGYGIGNIWAINIETKEPHQITQEKDSAQTRIDVTPDGNSIVYGSYRTGNYQIWQSDLDGTNSKQLTTGESKDFSEILSDGKWIVFAKVSGGLWKKNLESGEQTQIMKETPGKVHFSPTDPKIFSAFFNDYKIKDKHPWLQVIFNTDNLPEYKDLEIAAMDLFDWTPDGREIYYVDNGESFNNIWKISPETLVKEQITNFADQRIANVSLSPDGKTFAVSRGIATGNILKISGF